SPGGAPPSRCPAGSRWPPPASARSTPTSCSCRRCARARASPTPPDAWRGSSARTGGSSTRRRSPGAPARSVPARPPARRGRPCLPAPPSSAPPRPGERRIVLGALVDLGGARGWCHTTHLHWRLGDGLAREKQVVAADRAARERGGDVHVHILGGDFNAAPDCDEIRFLAGRTTLA